MHWFRDHRRNVCRFSKFVLQVQIYITILKNEGPRIRNGVNLDLSFIFTTLESYENIRP